MKIRSLIVILAVLAWFVAGVSRLETGRQEQGRLQLEEAVRRTVAACYSVEGFYPPNVQYMQEHYGLQYDPGRYTVCYEIAASNLMPAITVLEK